MKAQIPEDKKATEYLANERTFLAWIRTSISIISLGFVVAKFGVWLRELATRLMPQIPVRNLHSSGMSLPIGITMMTLGGILAILAAWHYRVVNQAIQRGDLRSNYRLVIIVAIAVALLAAMMIAYMLSTSENL